ncbi:hypothetical protein BH11MYX3_BH11MYX3_15420 [soil metagenome]
MPDRRKPKPAERVTTDDSLRTEREKTDEEIAASRNASSSKAAEVVAVARDKADAVLTEARDKEDVKLEAEGLSDAKSSEIDRERVREDAALQADRQGADDALAAARDESIRRDKALINLLEYERHDTDLRLEIERMRADAALTSREDFLAIVTHDLRNLLGGIALGAELLRDAARAGHPAVTIDRHAERIQRCTAQMNRLIGDLMDIASLDAGRLSVVPVPQDPAVLIRETMDAFHPPAVAQGITLTSEIGSDVGMVALDHSRMLQVLANLVGNALKFTRAGGSVSIRAEGHGEDVRFSIRDTGEGIAADRLAQVFDRFFQTHTNDRRGLGLGLYIAKSIVDAHKGKIWVESTPGIGSTFFVSLPRG